MTHDAMLACRYFISGDVQGVGFRYFVLREVQKIGSIQGYVRNLRDGRVEVYAEAPSSELRQLEESLKRGPRGSTVSRVDSHQETATGNYPDFRITF